MKTKYIVVERGGHELPYIFSPLVNHIDVFRAVGGIIKGAGFCHITLEGTWEVYGRSESINIDSREEDADVLNRWLLGYGE